MLDFVFCILYFVKYKMTYIKKHMTMTQAAARAIRQNILNGRYLTGTRLVPLALEEELGLGRVAIREALRELAGTGIVVTVPNKGTMVAPTPTIHEITALFEARFVLEGQAAAMAAVQITQKEIQRLENLYDMMEEENITLQEGILLNREFHLTIYEASGWDFACKVIGQLVDQVLIFRALKSSTETDYRVFNRDHKQIVQALKSRDPDKSRKLVVTNIARGFEELKQVHKRA